MIRCQRNYFQQVNVFSREHALRLYRYEFFLPMPIQILIFKFLPISMSILEINSVLIMILYFKYILIYKIHKNHIKINHHMALFIELCLNDHIYIAITTEIYPVLNLDSNALLSM